MERVKKPRKEKNRQEFVKMRLTRKVQRVVMKKSRRTSRMKVKREKERDQAKDKKRKRRKTKRMTPLQPQCMNQRGKRSRKMTSRAMAEAKERVRAADCWLSNCPPYSM